MYRILKTWAIDCAHVLRGLPAGHKCGRLHGHTYSITIELASPLLDPLGMIADYGLLDAVVKPYDHQDWNEYLAQPTAECIAAFLGGRVRVELDRTGHGAVAIVRVRVAETANTWAEWADG